MKNVITKTSIFHAPCKAPSESFCNATILMLLHLRPDAATIMAQMDEAIIPFMDGMEAQERSGFNAPALSRFA
jgi:hypothetical protein